MLLTVQGSVAEVTNGSSHSVSVQPVETTHVNDPIVPRVVRQAEILTSSGLTLPPLTPLHQTCLLLI